jgi:phosphomannomutase
MLVFADLVASLKADGRTVPDALDDLARRFGVHATSQWSLRLPGLDGVAQREVVMAGLRAGPPTGLAGRPVVRFVDLLPAGGPLPSSDVVVLHLDAARVVIRPSGTEPKLKCYFEVIAGVGDDVTEARASAAAEMLVLRRAVADLVGNPLEPTT